MTSYITQVTQILKKPTRWRRDDEIQQLVPWLRRWSKSLQGEDTDVIRDVMKDCQMETFQEDDVIVKQGEIGECCYIVLTGNVSVYIDTRQTGEDALKSPRRVPNRTPSPSKTPHGKTSESPDGGKSTSHSPVQRGKASPVGKHPSRPADDISGIAAIGKVITDTVAKGENGKIVNKQISTKRPGPDRYRFGKHVATYGQGKLFGELALLDEDHTRNASVVADDSCSLIMIDIELYDRTLRTSQQIEFAAVSTFVNKHPYFADMLPRLKRLLEMSFRKERYSYNMPIVTQGEPVRGLMFVTKGQAKVLAEPGRYRAQYEDLWPFEAGIDVYSREFEWLREPRKQAILRKYDDPTVWEFKPEGLVVRRTEGYAASEKRLQSKNLYLCNVRDGEIIGDIETCLNLKTHLQSVVSLSDTEVYVLDAKNFERFIANKRNQSSPQLLNAMKENVMVKLQNRMKLKQGNSIQLYEFLCYKLLDEQLPPAPKELPPLKASKNLPDRDYQIQQLIERFKEGKAPLVESVVPGTLFYKELMKEKARSRRLNNVNSDKIKTRHAQQRARRKPRSIIQMRESLKEMLESDLVTMEQNQKQKLLKDKKSSSYENLAQSEECASVGDRSQLEMDTERETSEFSSHSKLPPITPAPETVRPESVTPHEITKSEDGMSVSDVQQHGLPPIGEIDETLYPSTPRRPPLPPQDTAHPHSASKEGRVPNTISEEQESVKANTHRSNDVQSVCDAPVGEEASLKFMNETVQNNITHQLQVTTGRQFVDHRSGEAAVSDLESRLKEFHLKYGSDSGSKETIVLPKLRRFEIDREAMNYPRPGGKVFVRPRRCRFADSEIAVKGHEHVRFKMVPELPDFAHANESSSTIQEFLRSTVDGPHNNR